MALQIVEKKGKKILKGSLPKGTLSWVTVTGEGRPNYNEDGMVYQASIAWPEEIGQKVVDQVQAYFDSVSNDKGMQGSMGHTIGVLVDSGDTQVEKFIKPEDLTDKHTRSGNIQMQFSTNVEFNGKKNKIAIYNALAKKVQLAEGTSIGNGSLGSLQVQIVWGETAKKQFISKYLQAVQITKLVEYVGDADFDTDDADEDAWTGESVDEETGFTGEVPSEGSIDLG